MRNLLMVSNRRLFKNTLFWVSMAITLALSLYISLTNAPEMAEWAKAGEDVALEDCFFNLLPILGLVYAAFLSLFLGVEQSDGGLRNKLIAGHSRVSVFLSLFFVSVLGCLLITAAWLIGSLPGLCYFDFGFGWKTFGMFVLLSAASSVVFAAIYTTVSLLIHNKAISAVVCLVLWFIMLFTGSALDGILSAPMMTCDYEWINGAYVPGPEYPNPAYISGAKRIVLDIISRINPTCSAIRMSNKEYAGGIYDILYSFGTVIAVVFGGCIAVNRKDLK